MLLVIDPSDLLPKQLSDFNDNKVKPEIQTLRYNHYEAKRKLKLKAIQNLMQKAQKTNKSSGRQLSQLLDDVGALNSKNRAASVTPFMKFENNNDESIMMEEYSPYKPSKLTLIGLQHIGRAFGAVGAFQEEIIHRRSKYAVSTCKLAS